MIFWIYAVRGVNDASSQSIRFAIARCYDGKFLNWCDLDSRINYGDREINEHLGADGSVMVSRKQAELIVKKLGEMSMRGNLW